MPESIQLGNIGHYIDVIRKAGFDVPEGLTLMQLHTSADLISQKLIPLNDDESRDTFQNNLDEGARYNRSIS